MTINEIFNQLLLGNGSIITSENIRFLNSRAMELYNSEELNQNQIQELKELLMSCNILYNRTDLSLLPIEDGFYDLLLEKYKKYDSHFQVGSQIVELRNLIENDLENPKKIAESPIIFEKPVERNEVQEYMRREIMRIGKPSAIDKYDYSESPIEYIQSPISKRSHNTAHNHPDLVGTLDKAKFVLIKDAIDTGVINDPNVKILERDFFHDHIKKGIIDPNQEIEIVAELKYDGISVEADCGLEVFSARTRGDTGIGEAADITPILKGYVFKHAGIMIGEKPIGVKFEAIMTKNNLRKFNELRGRNYSNCRTAIVGLFGASDAYLFRDLITLVPLAIDRNDVPMIKNRLEEIEFANQIFRSHGEPLRYAYFKGTLTEILYYIKAFWDEAKIARDYLDFMYDGIVISYLDENIRHTLGRKNYINKYSMAVKFDPEEKQTIFRGYTYEVGQHGQITPMIHYDPIEFFGTIHTKSTGSSYARFQDLGLKYGDIINVKYMNDVMPYVSRLDCKHNRENQNPLEKFIDYCPICKSKLIFSDSGKTVICPNMECPGRSIQRMVNMFAKLNIKGFSEASFSALKKNHLYEIVSLSEDYLVQVLGTADGTKFKESINQLITNPLQDYIIMGALGFTSIAHKKWKAILEKIRLIDLYHLYLKSGKDINRFNFLLNQTLSSIGPITLGTIAKEFGFFEMDIECILSWGNLVDSYGKNSSYKMQIRFTGIRNKQLSELLCNAGYDADDSSSAGKNTDILLVPYEGFVSSKVKKVSDKCKIVPIDKFLNHMETYIGEKLT